MMINRCIKGLRYLTDMRAEDIWMLAVDGQFYREEKGPIGFDAREPGCVAGIIKGLIAAINTIDAPCSFENINKIQQQCIKDVRTQNRDTTNSIRENSVTFGILPHWFSLEGLTELSEEKDSAKILLVTEALLTPEQMMKLPKEDREKKMETMRIGSINFAVVPYKTASQNFPVRDFKIISKLGTSALTSPLLHKLIPFAKQEPPEIGFIFQPIVGVKNINEKLKAITDKFNHDSKAAKNDDDLLRAIIIKAKELCKTHPYRDANNRSFINCDLNVTLMKYGFCPVILKDPNVFEFHTVDQLLAIVKEGMAITEKLLKLPDEPVYGFKSAEIPRDDQEKYTEIGRMLFKIVALKMNALGKVAMKEKRFDDAAEYFELMYHCKNKSAKSADQKTELLLELAKSVQELGQHAKCKKYLLAANTIASQFNLSEQIKQIQEKLGEVEILLKPSPAGVELKA